MNPYVTLASYIMAAAVGAGSMSVWKNLEIANIQLERKDERIASQRAARVEAERRVATQRAADLKAQAAVRTAVVDRVRLDALGSGLRDTTAAMRASPESGAACHRQVDTLTVVFDQCVERYGVMAGHAQDWYIEAVKQNEAAQ